MEKIKVIPKPIRKWVYLRLRDILSVNYEDKVNIEYKGIKFDIINWDGFCPMVARLLKNLPNIDYNDNKNYMIDKFPELAKYRPEGKIGKYSYWFPTVNRRVRLDIVNKILKEHFNIE